MERLPLESLEVEKYDVVIIGAGAVGCASAKQLAGRGFKTLLIDRGDIGAGTFPFKSDVIFWSGLFGSKISIMANSIPSSGYVATTRLHCRSDALSS
ncbi:FAD-dependent oxidoreductase [Acinetobacter sp.]|uniref:FAD-dependent oxidoreductase n=1 Tax=Acinetobacter sp. TaxID=472 RepID=UPI00258E7154|nr:FAD-dependent oxidoreductase [Acinetobacter sp.]